MLVRIGSRADVAPGTMRAFDVDGRRIAVASVDGTFYAFDDTCTHAGCSLADGELDGTKVTCPCHGSEFDARSGAVLRGPAAQPVDTVVVSTLGEDLLAEA